MQEGDLILGTVEKVTNTITFVDLPNGKKGTIVSSEIAPGRIKHMRAHVVPNKKIVCKILRVSGEHINLSLRRVTSKEKKEVMQEFKQTQAIKVAFKQILGEKTQTIEEKVTKDFGSPLNFIEKAKEDSKLIEKYIPKEKQEAIKKITEKKQKAAELKQNIEIKCLGGEGIKKIKEVFKIENKNVSISYISAGRFKLKLSSKNFKQGKKEMTEIMGEIEKRAKKNDCEFSHEEEK
jgi:translation initiation factor 2 alpha subunit (eIF-2alpha)